MVTWLDVLAGNLGAFFLIIALLHLRRVWLAERSAGALFCLFTLGGLGLGIFILRAGCWAGTWGCS